MTNGAADVPYGTALLENVHRNPFHTMLARASRAKGSGSHWEEWRTQMIAGLKKLLLGTATVSGDQYA